MNGFRIEARKFFNTSGIIVVLAFVILNVINLYYLSGLFKERYSVWSYSIPGRNWFDLMAGRSYFLNAILSECLVIFAAYKILFSEYKNGVIFRLKHSALQMWKVLLYKGLLLLVLFLLFEWIYLGLLYGFSTHLYETMGVNRPDNLQSSLSEFAQIYSSFCVRTSLFLLVFFKLFKGSLIGFLLFAVCSFIFFILPQGPFYFIYVFNSAEVTRLVLFPALIYIMVFLVLNFFIES